MRRSRLQPMSQTDANRVSAGQAEGWNDGEQREVTVEEQSVVVVRYEGEFYALRNLCTHKDFPLLGGDVSDGKITCIKHGGKFELETGKARVLPAVKAVRIYRTSVEDGLVMVEAI